MVESDPGQPENRQPGRRLDDSDTLADAALIIEAPVGGNAPPSPVAVDDMTGDGITGMLAPQDTSTSYNILYFRDWQNAQMAPTAPAPPDFFAGEDSECGTTTYMWLTP